MIAPIPSLVPVLDPDFLSAARWVWRFRTLFATASLPVLYAHAAAS